MVNVGPEGRLVLPCYVRNEYAGLRRVINHEYSRKISL